ncbi:Poly(A)-specific ribonuclease PARN-like [Zea mays]|uniref:Poly(A)-specific ribonuclease PARN-like n=1 Tax=Zea mays TaxID=4577 RepID=A0A1D6Q1N0_MAIZE|nr:Poly(A)-specific ribonuclease PARN-like [Zea mays]AQK52525.1 Poly(A)-specific ribonuclease PARN-like [Zea mays]
MAAPRAAAASAKQVTRQNFAEAVLELRAHLEACDYVAVAAQKTGAPTGWRRALPVDTAETAYLKAKLAAESFQPLQIAVCPFRQRNSYPSTLVAYPYNFHLFPRDELQLGMPSYSFSCQPCYLSTIANDGFDFNMCIYDGEYSLSRLILGAETYGSRPSMSIDVCSDRQVQLVLEMDIQKLEDEQNFKFRGFREVIDLLSSSQKPIISYSCLNDLTMLHTKFIAPLPPNMHEFMCSLKMVFPNVVDISHLWRQIGPLRKAKNIQAALSYLQRQYFVPIEIEIPQQDGTSSITKNEQNVLRITKLFAKLSNLLKISPECQLQSREQCTAVEEYCNIFYPSCVVGGSDDANFAFESDTTETVSTDNIIFLWGFREKSVKELKSYLIGLHQAFSEDFEVKLLDKTCSALIFRDSNTAMQLLKEIGSEGPSLNRFFSEGLKAAGFEVYKKVCRLGLWDSDLAEVLEDVSSELGVPTLPECSTSQIYWNSELMLDLKEYLE